MHKIIYDDDARIRTSRIPQGNLRFKLHSTEKKYLSYAEFLKEKIK